LTPNLVERVHALYEELGRQDVIAVQEFEKAEEESKHEAPIREPIGGALGRASSMVPM